MKSIDDFTLIKEELSKYSVQIAREFMKAFPCERKNYFIPLETKRTPVKVAVKGRQVGWSFISGGPYTSITWDPKYLHLPNDNVYVICASAQDFWNRWNRFKKIKVFL